MERGERFYMNDLIVQAPDGAPRFVGKEDPNNPPVQAPPACKHGTDQCSHMQCPVCGGYFDYLLGENTPDGGVQGCEKDYKLGGKKGTHENETTEKIVFD